MSFEFAAPFDGTQPEIPEAEQQMVSPKFASFVEDSLLGNAKFVKTLGSHDWLKLSNRGEVKLGQSSKAGFFIYIEDYPGGPDFIKAVSVLEIDEAGYGGNTVSYRLGEDGVVRRMDIPKATPETKKLDRELFLDEDDELSPGVALGHALKVQSAIKEAIENSKLETEFGLNNQPIGLKELDEVISLADTAKAVDLNSF